MELSLNDGPGDLGIQQPTPRPGRLADWWARIATFLAILGLIDVSHQLVEWAAVIHELVSGYVAIREEMFRWLPFHIPPDWHNYIFLTGVMLSVANVGYYRETGRIFAVVLLRFEGSFNDDDDTPSLFTRIYS